MTAAPEATQPGETPEATPDAARTDAGAPAVALEAATSNQMGAYSQRELLFVAREAAGELSFRYIRNDGDPQNLEWLAQLKNVYSRQLPNMPREYIARLVFERRHRSCGIVTGEGECIGGITFRTFPGTQCAALGEIAFCAVSATHQVKGHGTRLMNWTKEWARTRDGLSHFLTYADNNAVGYFAKQGFTKTITLPRAVWGGFIKDYDGGTLMEFVIHPRVCYVELAQAAQTARAALAARLRPISNSHVVHAPLGSAGKPFQPVAWHDIPGVKAAGYRGPPEAAFDVTVNGEIVPATREALQAYMGAALALARAHDDSLFFREPVDAADVPDYYSVVSDPMDLQTMQERLDAGDVYKTLDIFRAELARIWANARHYNGDETIFAKAANAMARHMDEHFLSTIHARAPPP